MNVTLVFSYRESSSNQGLVEFEDLPMCLFLKAQSATILIEIFSYICPNTLFSVENDTCKWWLAIGACCPISGVFVSSS